MIISKCEPIEDLYYSKKHLAFYRFRAVIASPKLNPIDYPPATGRVYISRANHSPSQK
ncbi:hypothetical protein ACFE6N_03780 [Pedobacter sp. BG31]|uniref:hypothetical protein n=1 Tax=Pedobacter sp. BG31 TaxID=3349697 RepID=UPI0035F3C864